MRFAAGGGLCCVCFSVSLTIPLCCLLLLLFQLEQANEQLLQNLAGWENIHRTFTDRTLHLVRHEVQQQLESLRNKLARAQRREEEVHTGCIAYSSLVVLTMTSLPLGGSTAVRSHQRVVRDTNG